MSQAMTIGTPLRGAPPPGCPKCGGPMWDNRADKRSAKAPDFRCRDRACDGRIWPGQRVAMALFAPVEAAGSGQPAAIGEIMRGDARGSLCRSYLDVTDFVLSKVRDKYQAAGVTCTDATIAAIVATLFIEASGRKRTGCGR